MIDITQRGILSRHYLDDYQSSSSHLSGSLTDSAVLPIFADIRNPQRTAVQQSVFVIAHSVWQSSDNNYANIYRDLINLCHSKLQHRNKLLNSLDLSAGWDGEGGRVPTKQDVDNAINFLDYIPPRGIMSVRVVIAGDGEVGFDWRESGTCLEVGFNDGEISFFAQINENEFGADMDFKNSIPEELKFLMSACFSG